MLFFLSYGVHSYYLIKRHDPSVVDEGQVAISFQSITLFRCCSLCKRNSASQLTSNPYVMDPTPYLDGSHDRSTTDQMDILDEMGCSRLDINLYLPSATWTNHISPWTKHPVYPERVLQPCHSHDEEFPTPLLHHSLTRNYVSISTTSIKSPPCSFIAR